MLVAVVGTGGCVGAESAVFSGLAIDVQRHLLYMSDEGQGQVRELELKLKLNYTARYARSRVVDLSLIHI